jgi:hypothetical protein
MKTQKYAVSPANDNNHVKENSKIQQGYHPARK